MCDLRLPSSCKLDLCSSRCYTALFDTYQHSGATYQSFKGRTVFLDYLTVRLSQNVSNYVPVNVVLHPRTANIPELKLSPSTLSVKEITKSDVWLTVHRNSVWIRKTN